MFIVAALLTVRALAQADVESVRAQLVGVYTLIEYAAHGDEPTGRIWYEPSGQMSAMLFPPGREPLANDASAEDFRASMRGLVAYYGSYTIDPVAGTVTHHIEGASNPRLCFTEIDVDQVRVVFVKSRTKNRGNDELAGLRNGDVGRP
jgi:hypothetical protein